MNFINLKKFQIAQTTKRLGLWLILSLALSLIFFRDFWTSLPAMLSPSWVLGSYHAAPWGVLALCLIFVWLKRKELWRAISESRQVIRLEG